MVDIQPDVGAIYSALMRGAEGAAERQAERLAAMSPVEREHYDALWTGNMGKANDGTPFCPHRLSRAAAALRAARCALRAERKA